jgi:micrococcal nuclease
MISDLILDFQKQLCFLRTGIVPAKQAFYWCAITCVFISTIARANDEVNGKVTAVLDGNTIQISCFCEENEVRRVTLYGIDSPELGQEFGDEARRFLEKMILQKDVKVQFKGKDRFGNYQAVVKINGKTDPRIELLRNGFAWTSEKNPSEALEQYRLEAQQKKRGLWTQENPVAPWTYRRQQSMSKPKSS